MPGAHLKTLNLIVRTAVFFATAGIVLSGCQTTEVIQERAFNAYAVKADSRGELYRHELLAPAGFDRDDAVRLIQFCAAALAAKRGYSSILFQDSAVVDRERGWEVPRFRVRINARYANTAVAKDAGAADLATRLRDELRASWSAIDSMCSQEGPAQ